MAKMADSEITIWKLTDEVHRLRAEAAIARRCLAVLVYRAGGDVNLTPGELKGVDDQVRLTSAKPDWSTPVRIWLEDAAEPGSAG